MTDLEFDQLVIVNFKVFRNRVIFNLKLSGAGLHYVRGRNKLEPSLHSNGAGKSSLWDALVWCLFGRTIDSLHNTDIKPWTGPKETRVAVTMQVRGEGHKIERKTFPNRLTLDGANVGQERIDQLLGMGFEVFTHTVVLGQGRPLFLEVPPRKKLDLLGEVLPLEVWEQRSVSAAAIVEEYDCKLSELERKLEITGSDLEQVKAEIADTSREHDAWEVERFQHDLQHKADIGKLEERLAQQQSERNKADLGYDSAMTQVKDLRRQHQQLSEYLAAHVEEQTRLQVKQEALREHRKVLKQELERELAAGETCPTCGQAMTTQGLKAHRDDLEIKQQEVLTLISRGRGQLEVLNQQITDVRQQITQGKQHITEFQNKADAANDRMIELDPKLAELKAQIEQTKKTKSQEERAENPHEAGLHRLRTKRAELKEQYKAAEVRRDAIRPKRERAAFWVKGFKEVRLFVIEEVLRELEVASNALLDQFGLIGWTISYKIERETQTGNVSRAINVEVMSPHNPEPVKFESWSGGQQQRLRLIGSLALSDVLLERASIRSSLEVLDEPSRSITTHGVRDMIDALAERANQRGTQIYYTDHGAIESSHFASTICVTLDEDGARLK